MKPWQKGLAIPRTQAPLLGSAALGLREGGGGGPSPTGSLRWFCEQPVGLFPLSLAAILFWVPSSYTFQHLKHLWRQTAEESNHGKSKALIKIEFQMSQQGSLCLTPRDLESGSNNLHLLVLQLPRCEPPGEPLNTPGSLSTHLKSEAESHLATLESGGVILGNPGSQRTPDWGLGHTLSGEGTVYRLGGEPCEAC